MKHCKSLVQLVCEGKCPQTSKLEQEYWPHTKAFCPLLC